MFMSTLMTLLERGRRKTKLIKASDSPHHYGEFSGDIAVYFHRHFNIPPLFNYPTCLKSFSTSNKQPVRDGRWLKLSAEPDIFVSFWGCQIITLSSVIIICRPGDPPSKDNQDKMQHYLISFQ